MNLLCIPLPRQEPRLRAVVVIVIYLAAFRLVPADGLPLTLAAVLGGLAVIESNRPARLLRQGGTCEGDR